MLRWVVWFGTRSNQRLELSLPRLACFLHARRSHIYFFSVPVSRFPSNFCRRCSGALHIVQDFLGMPEDLFSTDLALSPALRDQKRAELLLYRLLNQADSPASRMKVRVNMFRFFLGYCVPWERVQVGVVHRTDPAHAWKIFATNFALLPPLCQCFASVLVPVCLPHQSRIRPTATHGRRKWFLSMCLAE